MEKFKNFLKPCCKKPNPYLILKYNVTSTTEPTPLINEAYISNVTELIIDDKDITNFESFDSVEIDGFNTSITYVFNKLGEHIVKFRFNTNVLNSRYFSSNKNIKEIIKVPTDLTEISSGIFQNSSLEKINLKTSCGRLDRVCAGAFSGCTSLKEIQFAETITYMGGSTFGGCTGLTEITLPNSLLDIYGGVFTDCTGIKKFVFNGMKTIGETTNVCNGYQNNPNLEEIVINEGTESLYSGIFRNNPNLKKVTIPASVNNITGSIFYNSNNIELIVINNPKYSIKDGCIWEEDTKTVICAALKDASIPIDAENIGYHAFSYRTFESIDIPNTVKKIDGNAFYHCENLKSIVIPESVVTLGVECFAYTPALSSIIVDEDNTVYDSRNNCNAIISTENNILILGCSNTVIPQSITKIGTSAFYACTNLKSIIIPEGVETIGMDAFDRCTSLTELTFPSTLKNISDAVDYCSNLIKITSLAVTAPTISGYSGIGKPAQNGTLYVPKGSKSSYNSKWIKSSYALYLGYYGWSIKEIE